MNWQQQVKEWLARSRAIIDVATPIDVARRHSHEQATDWEWQDTLDTSVCPGQGDFVWVRLASDAVVLAYHWFGRYHLPETAGDSETVEYFENVTHWARMVTPRFPK